MKNHSSYLSFHAFGGFANNSPIIGLLQSKLYFALHHYTIINNVKSLIILTALKI